MEVRRNSIGVCDYEVLQCASFREEENEIIKDLEKKMSNGLGKTKKALMRREKVKLENTWRFISFLHRRFLRESKPGRC